MITIQERYTKSTRTSDLSSDSKDVEVLIAAAYAGKKHRYTLALEFYRLQSGDTAGLNRLSGVAGQWLHNRSRRKGRKRLTAAQARDIATRALIWWMNPTCKACNGIGHPLITGTPVINFGHDCAVCHGTGKHPIQRVVPIGTSSEAMWLTDYLDEQVSIVFDDIRKLLRKFGD
jgi:hypothetical protein